MKILLLLLFPTLLFALELDTSTRLERIAFGSCNKQYRPQPLWVDMLQVEPQLWVWGGDNVYFEGKTPAELQKEYDLQNSQPQYQLFKSRVPMIGIWDDHDYGPNNGGADHPWKKESQQMHLDFMGVPKDSPRRTQEGIYSSVVSGPEGEQVKFIMLDNRYFRTKEDLLGETQWQWFERELANSTAQVNFVVSGLALFVRELPGSEDWRDTATYTRMLNLLKKYRHKGIIVLSGDKHFGNFHEEDGIVEFMSSGLTHTTPLVLRPFVRRYYHNPYIGLNWGLIEIHWNENPLRVSLSLRGVDGMVAKEKQWQLVPILNKWQAI